MHAASVDYRSYIQREFEARIRRNPRYSLRAFARDLGMQPSKLSEVLRGHCGLSSQSARRIGERMRLTELEIDYFVELVKAKHERSLLARELARERLKNLEEVHGFDELSLDRFRIIADWYHFAILELSEVQDFEPQPGWVAKRLDISQREAAAAIERLVDCGLLRSEPDGRLVQTEQHLATPSGTPDRALRDHHAQILSKAAESLETVGVSERDFSAITMAFDATRLDDARKQLKRFRRNFCKDLGNTQRKNRVYCLAVQFFPVDKKERARA